MGVRFECSTVIAADPATVFDLALDIDAHTKSLARSGERAVGGVTAGRIGLGEEVTWRAVHFGLPFTMTSRVTELERPVRFVDEQVRGPFRTFRHEHLFEAAGGDTVMIDRITFTAPFWLLGAVVERAVLGAYLRRLIEERNGFLKEAAAGGTAGTDPGATGPAP
jgi:ligand-binding SRPBCC domain-containing protein